MGQAQVERAVAATNTGYQYEVMYRIAPEEYDKVWRKMVDLIAVDEVVPEAEAIRRIERYTRTPEPRRTIINGTSPTIAHLIQERSWKWADFAAGTLQRAPSPIPVNLVSIFVPPAKSNRAIEGLRNELRALRHELRGAAGEPRPLTVGKGRALVFNQSQWDMNSFALNYRLSAGEIVECDEAAAKEATLTILELIDGARAAQIIQEASA